MEKFLKDFVPGEVGRVVKISNTGKIKRRLYDMGITPGAEIKLLKVAPMGDPLCILIRGYDLSLRKDEAAEVLMEVK